MAPVLVGTSKVQRAQYERLCLIFYLTSSFKASFIDAAHGQWRVGTACDVGFGGLVTRGFTGDEGG